MQTLWTFTKCLPVLLAVFLCGCWMGGQTRSNFSPTPAPTSPGAPPIINSPQYGPTAPLPPAQSAPPAVNGPAIEGPMFPPSSKGFDRKLYSRSGQDEESRSNYAGTTPAPIISDGPIANQPPKVPQQVGYIELPPAP